MNDIAPERLMLDAGTVRRLVARFVARPDRMPNGSILAVQRVRRRFDWGQVIRALAIALATEKEPANGRRIASC
jgi:hypothetical protein